MLGIASRNTVLHWAIRLHLRLSYVTPWLESQRSTTVVILSEVLFALMFGDSPPGAGSAKNVLNDTLFKDEFYMRITK